MPDKINGYEILSAIGSGAFGRTYRVKKGGQVYAMKVLKPEAIRDDIDRKRFQRECRTLQKITSEHVVSYHDHGVFEQDGVETYYVVMGFVEGSKWSKAHPRSARAEGDRRRSYDGGTKAPVTR